MLTHTLVLNVFQFVLNNIKIIVAFISEHCLSAYLYVTGLLDVTLIKGELESRVLTPLKNSLGSSTVSGGKGFGAHIQTVYL